MAIITIVLPSSTVVLTKGHTSRGTSSRSYMSSSVAMATRDNNELCQNRCVKVMINDEHTSSCSQQQSRHIICQMFPSRRSSCVCAIDNCTAGLIGCWCRYLGFRLVWRALTSLFLFQHTCGPCEAHMYELANRSSWSSQWNPCTTLVIIITVHSYPWWLWVNTL